MAMRETRDDEETSSARQGTGKRLEDRACASKCANPASDTGGKAASSYVEAPWGQIPASPVLRLSITVGPVYPDYWWMNNIDTLGLGLEKIGAGLAAKKADAAGSPASRRALWNQRIR